MPVNKIMCEECNNCFGKKNIILSKHLCENCKILDKYSLITKTNAKKNYLLNDYDLSNLKYYNGKTSYCIATYYTIDDLNNVFSIKHNISKDDIKEYLRLILEKKKERKIKSELIKENKKIERKNKLITELKKVKLNLRNDSVLCQDYINGDSKYDLQDIIQRMCEMKYLFEYCHMKKCKKIAYENQKKEISAGYFPDCSIFDDAEDIALTKYSDGKYPNVFPWLN